MNDVWPEDPRDLLEPHEITVTCGGADHVVRWERGEVTCEHEDSRQVVGALGGQRTPCEQLAHAWRNAVDGELVGTTTAVLHYCGLPLEIAKELSADDAEAFVARASTTGAVRHLVTRELQRWLETLGATGPFQIDVGVFQPVDPSGDDPVPVGGRASWGRGFRTRAAVLVTTDWYAHVRASGLLVDGQFNLGENRDGAVVLRPRFDLGDFPVAWATRHRADALPVADPEAFRRAAAQPANPDDEVYVGGFCRWDSDHYTGGMMRIGAFDESQFVIFHSVPDANAWMNATNFYETFIVSDPDIVPDYYETEVLEQVPHTFGPTSPPMALLAEAVRHDVDPARWAVRWVEWVQGVRE